MLLTSKFEAQMTFFDRLFRCMHFYVGYTILCVAKMVATFLQPNIFALLCKPMAIIIRYPRAILFLIWKPVPNWVTMSWHFGNFVCSLYKFLENITTVSPCLTYLFRSQHLIAYIYLYRKFKIGRQDKPIKYYTLYPRECACLLCIFCTPCLWRCACIISVHINFLPCPFVFNNTYITCV